MTKRVALVTGSRHHTSISDIYTALDDYAPDLVIEGGAPGADAIAAQWVVANGAGRLHWPDEHWGGHMTGPDRNQAMVDVAAALVAAGWEAKVFAFPHKDSRGTWSCVNKAKAAQLAVVVYQP